MKQPAHPLQVLHRLNLERVVDVDTERKVGRHQTQGRIEYHCHGVAIRPGLLGALALLAQRRAWLHDPPSRERPLRKLLDRGQARAEGKDLPREVGVECAVRRADEVDEVEKRP